MPQQMCRTSDLSYYFAVMPNFRPALFCGHVELQTGLRYAADVQKQKTSAQLRNLINQTCIM
jgi:hypothetical protein